MATRRLKFKPKPILASLVRRPRDKEEIPGLTIAEQTNTNNTLVVDNGEANNSDSSSDKQVLNNDTSFVEKVKQSQSENVTETLIKTTNCEKEVEQQCFGGNASGVQQESQRKIIRSPLEEDTNINTETTLNKLEIKNKSDISEFSLTDNSPQSTVPSDRVSSTPSLASSKSSSQPDQVVCDKPIEKSNFLKILPRFGRSRYKPVLSSRPITSQRTKSEVTDNRSIDLGANPIRTDSVIKCVESELNKINKVSRETEKEPSEISSDVETNVVSVTSSKNDYKEIIIQSNKDDSNIVLNANNTLTSSTVNISYKESDPEKQIVNQPADRLNNVTNVINENNSDISTSNTKPPAIKRVHVCSIKPVPKPLMPKPSPRLAEAISREIILLSSDSEDEGKKKTYANLKETSDKPLNKDDNQIKTIKISKRKLDQCSTFSKLGQERNQQLSKRLKDSDGSPDKTKLKMLDLIFNNPKNNPMTFMVDEVLEEQRVDDVEPAAEVMPVPQLKVGPDGQIMLDPESLVIEATGVKRRRDALENSEVVQENGIVRYTTFSKKKSRSGWNANETLQFYQALSTIGSDFSLMTKLFPSRTRNDLKLKFKREERTNMHLIDKAMTLGSSFEFQSLLEEREKENEEIERRHIEKLHAKEAAKKDRALKKQVALKNKTVRRRLKDKRIRLRSSAFKEFSCNELDQLYETKSQKKPIKRKKKPQKKIFSDSDDSFFAMSSGSESPDTNFYVDDVSDNTTIRNECEEINESLKQKMAYDKSTSQLDHESDKEGSIILSPYDLFGSPLKVSADDEFGTPLEGPADDELPHENVQQFNIVIENVPCIEATLLPDNVEEVSKISELGSFGDI